MSWPNDDNIICAHFILRNDHRCGIQIENYNYSKISFHTVYSRHIVTFAEFPLFL